MSSFRWLARLFLKGQSTVAPVVATKCPVKYLRGTRFVIARVNGRLESVPVAEEESPVGEGRDSPG
jgi:hypothetical protein